MVVFSGGIPGHHGFDGSTLEGGSSCSLVLEIPMSAMRWAFVWQSES
jgi:hypothetical protein